MRPTDSLHFALIAACAMGAIGCAHYARVGAGPTLDANGAAGAEATAGAGVNLAGTGYLGVQVAAGVDETGDGHATAGLEFIVAIEPKMFGDHERNTTSSRVRFHGMFGVGAGFAEPGVAAVGIGVDRLTLRHLETTTTEFFASEKGGLSFSTDHYKATGWGLEAMYRGNAVDKDYAAHVVYWSERRKR